MRIAVSRPRAQAADTPVPGRENPLLNRASHPQPRPSWLLPALLALAVYAACLAVRLGDRAARRAYAAMLAVSLLMVLPVLPGHGWAALALLSLPVMARPLRAVLAGVQGRDLLPVVRDTGRTELAYGLLLALVLALSS